MRRDDTRNGSACSPRNESELNKACENLGATGR